MIETKDSIIFAPWPGIDDGYKVGIRGRRVLILGESHHHSCKKDKTCRNGSAKDRQSHHRSLTFQAVDHWKDKTHSSPLSYRIPYLFGVSKEAFWGKVVFYNYLQTFAGPAARDRPKDNEWANRRSVEAFQAVLDQFQPDRILVLGKNLWKNLPSDLKLLAKEPAPESNLPVSGDVRSYDETERICYWYAAHSGKSALAMPIMHPAAVKFSPEEWVSPVAKWLDFNQS